MASKSRRGLWRRILEDWPVKVIALAVAVVIVLLTDIAGVAERYFSVPLQLRLAESVVPGQAYTDRVRVTLRGDESEIFRVLEDDIVAYADLTEHNSEGVYRAAVQLQKRGAALSMDALEIGVEPLNVTVTLEEKLISSVEVVPNLAGFPPVPGTSLPIRPPEVSRLTPLPQPHRAGQH